MGGLLNAAILVLIVLLLAAYDPDDSVAASSPTPRAGVALTWMWGSASAYGPGLYGNRTACGQTLTRYTIGVAHKTLPCGARLRVCRRGICPLVPVIDRGPYVSGRVLDITEGTTRRYWHLTARQWGVRTIRYRREYARGL